MLVAQGFAKCIKQMLYVKRRNCLLMTITFVLLISNICISQPVDANDPAELIKSGEVGFEVTLGNKLPLITGVTNQNGKEIQLDSLFINKKPTVFVPMYFGCPRLCGLLIDGFLSLVKELNLKAGTDYNIVFFSFDPTETHQLALEKSETIYKELNLNEDSLKSNVQFITASKDSIESIIKSLGFKYKFVSGEYVHSAGFYVLTPQGEISQYFTGIQFPAWDVRLAVIEASKGSIGSTIDHVLLYCFDFDPTKGKYTWAAFNVLRIGTLLALALFCLIAVKLAKKAKLKGKNFS